MARLRRPLPHLGLHISGLTLGVAGAGATAAAAVDAIHAGPDVAPLLAVGLALMLLGVALWWFTSVPARIELIDVFATVAVAWVVMAAAGSLPYLATGTLDSVGDALFESVSGFTTTGATVLRPIEGNSQGILFWRALSQWIGGMGVIVLVIAVLPTIGSGGMNLLQAEAPGPTGERLTPRVRHTARNLWVVYLGFTVVVGIAYLLAGMGPYDAVVHSFTTVSTGGFSPYNASLGHFESAVIEWIAIVAMFLAGGSFALWYRAVRGRFGPILQSIELRLYVVMVLGATIAIAVTSDSGAAGHDLVRDSAFSVVTILSTTGYGTADFGTWSQGAQLMLLLLMPLGGMAGSTAGGVKMIRLLAAASFAHREALRQLHPRMQRPTRIGSTVLPDVTANKVMGFLVLALATFGSVAVIIVLTGVDIVTAFSASATAFGNVGPGLGDIGPSSDFLALPAEARAVSLVAMLLGRLEIYPLLLALVAIPGNRFVRRYVLRSRNALRI